VLLLLSPAVREVVGEGCAYAAGDDGRRGQFGTVVVGGHDVILLVTVLDTQRITDCLTIITTDDFLGGRYFLPVCAVTVGGVGGGLVAAN
jgi:hypothetical protein